ncbi:hypothetical protein PBI_WALRUS_39 [Gordonia phage Walrus]|uniref:MmpS family membrane protein n=1 Tax=Gordonia phage Walrus TaxID=2517927 RepID=A0A481S2Q0_9CAUD|nr:hypothetical protein KNU50_gp39 [Gordonia phage Walrus]QBG78430.1 hypothetical protein PBI_WALRUS_39 [Gordonia phage Walrus]
MTQPPPNAGDQSPYQQPQYGQQPPPPPYPPQQPPKKRKKWPWILGAVVVLIIIIAVATSGGGGEESTDNTADSPGTTETQAPTEDGGDQPQPTTQQQESGTDGVVYEVTSDSGTANNITYFGEGGNQSQENGATLPWRSKAFDESDTMIKGVTAQNGGSGTITCKIIIDGKVEVENSSNGQYAVVSCNGDLF